VKEGDDLNGRNDRTDLGRESQLISTSIKLAAEIWTRPADHHTGQRLLENAAIKGLTEDRTRSRANLVQNLLAPRAATTEEISASN
jgi:hypothetical protein